MIRNLSGRVGAVAVVATGCYSFCDPFRESKTSTRLREENFPLAFHHHGKAKVRVLKVRHSPGNGGERHSVSEFTVHTRLYSPVYEKVFTDEDNSDLVATDTQKNTVYLIAKKTEAKTPENFGLDLASHFLAKYPMLTGAQIIVEETLWQRSVDSTGQPHNHAFVKVAPEKNMAVVRMSRNSPTTVTSSIVGMTILKTTASGFAGYLKDEITLLPDCDDRCLATEVSAEWNLNSDSAPESVDYSASRSAIKQQLIHGLFGSAGEGVFSASLQATIYDAGCLALSALPSLERISIDTPNLHYLPTTQLLRRLGAVAPDQQVRDVFIPTSEPSGTIHCEVCRK